MLCGKNEHADANIVASGGATKVPLTGSRESMVKASNEGAHTNSQNHPREPLMPLHNSTDQDM